MTIQSTSDYFRNIGIGGNIAINSVSNARRFLNNVQTNYNNYVKDKNAVDYIDSGVCIEDSRLLKSLEEFVYGTNDINDINGVNDIKEQVDRFNNEWPSQYKNTKSDLEQLSYTIGEGIKLFDEYKLLIENISKETFAELNEKFLELQSSYNTKRGAAESVLANAATAETNYKNYLTYAENAKGTSGEGDMLRLAEQYQYDMNSKLNDLKDKLPALQTIVTDMNEILEKGLKKNINN